LDSFSTLSYPLQAVLINGDFAGLDGTATDLALSSGMIYMFVQETETPISKFGCTSAFVELAYFTVED